jgi:hypothetical protein
MHDNRLVRGVLGDLIAMELEPLGAYLSAVDAGVRDVHAETYRRAARYARRLLRQGASLERVRQCARRSPALLELLEGLEVEHAPDCASVRCIAGRLVVAAPSPAHSSEPGSASEPG